MNNFVISIIVPVYNVKNYLDECIKSIINQTHSKLEIIIIDDGSTDGSAYICDSWKRMDNRICVIHTENRGVSHARNIGLENAHGDYVGFVDPDDWIEKDTYEYLLNKILECKADVAGGGYIREYVDGGKICLRKKPCEIYTRDAILTEIFSRGNQRILGWEIWDKLFKRELLNNIRFDEEVDAAEDMLFLWQAMKTNIKFVYIPLFKYHYRMRKGSAVNSKISPKIISSRYAIEKIWLMAQKEKENLKELIFIQYIANILLNTGRMLVFDCLAYNEDIKRDQIIIRKNLYKTIFKPYFSLKEKIWMCFLCMPYCIIKNLIFTLKNRIK